MNDLELVPLRKEDIEGALMLCRESMMHASHYSREQRQAWAAFDDGDWGAQLTQQHSWGAFGANHALLGVASWRVGDSNEAWLDLMYVTPEHQQQGIGSAILERIEEDVRTLGLHGIEAQASLHLQPLLSNRGYITLETRLPVVRGMALPCAWMRKVLI